MAAYISNEPLREIGADPVQLLRGREGIECQLLHVGLHQAILQGDRSKSLCPVHGQGCSTPEINIDSTLISIGRG